MEEGNNGEICDPDEAEGSIFYIDDGIPMPIPAYSSEILSFFDVFNSSLKVYIYLCLEDCPLLFELEFCDFSDTFEELNFSYFFLVNLAKLVVM